MWFKFFACCSGDGDYAVRLTACAMHIAVMLQAFNI